MLHGMSERQFGKVFQGINYHSSDDHHNFKVIYFVIEGY